MWSMYGLLINNLKNQIIAVLLQDFLYIFCIFRIKRNRILYRRVPTI